MYRLFGKKKPTTATTTTDPVSSIHDASTSLKSRGEDIDARITQLDTELLQYKHQLAKMRDGPAKRNVQQRAINVIKQKRMYETQRTHIYNQQVNMDQARFALESAKETQGMMNAMSSTKNALKATYKNMSIDKIEDLHDDMADLLEDTDEINDILGRNYNVPDDIDENDLLDELAGLEDELESDAIEQTQTTAAPDVFNKSANANDDGVTSSSLLPAAPSTTPGAYVPEAGSTTPQRATAGQIDVKL